MKVGAVERRLALLAVDKKLEGLDYRIPSRYLDTFPRKVIT